MWGSGTDASQSIKAAEDELLNHIASYRRRYNSLYPRGPVLLLMPENEDGVTVGVVSLVVPSPAPHPQLLALEDAAAVLADLISYTPPRPPPTLPSRVRSPAVVVRSQEGIGVECALVLVSVLLGAGYHALVVQGAARPALVARDTSHLPCPYLIHHHTVRVSLSLSVSYEIDWK
ncbi:coiled-coil domain-containing protein lobo [Procambarus clarkii]|uniref:coiled-coil domain-containing protein lobo n=1 Tax=Procambarus clarkii TaxID=6728 RepID=UPI0037446BE8